MLRDDVVFVNRQRGAGTWVLLDYELKQQGLNPRAIQGYERQEYTHLAVAAAVKSGAADCGLGILAAARGLDLDFVPLLDERYDLVIPWHTTLRSVGAAAGADPRPCVRLCSGGGGVGRLQDRADGAGVGGVVVECGVQRTERGVRILRCAEVPCYPFRERCRKHGKFGWVQGVRAVRNRLGLQWIIRG